MFKYIERVKPCEKYSNEPFYVHRRLKSESQARQWELTNDQCQDEVPFQNDIE